MHKKLIIIRGLPGSGKSTIARLMVDARFHMEADMFFTGADGRYNFDVEKLPEAHRWCQKEVENLMQRDTGNIVVSNCSVGKWEYEPYLYLAEEYGYSVQVITCEEQFSNIHGCPQEKVRAMNHVWEHHVSRLRVDIQEGHISWRYGFPYPKLANLNPTTR